MNVTLTNQKMRAWSDHTARRDLFALYHRLDLPPIWSGAKLLSDKPGRWNQGTPIIPASINSLGG